MIKLNNIEYLAGNKKILKKIYSPYEKILCDFLNDLSLSLIKNKKAKLFSDVMSFAFWCRKRNIEILKQTLNENYLRLGLGLIFHISPSNVPINFAYTFAFGLLSGNSNIVRVPSQKFDQVKIVCDVIKNLFQKKKYKTICKTNIFVRYKQDDQITSYFSSNCNARIIWGGDETIKNIRKIPIPERSIEITFADRYSFCVINSSILSKLNDNQLKNLVEKFYNDTYVMDQNACSSPHLIIWIGKKNQKIKDKFWRFLYQLVKKKYELENISAIDKYSKFMNDTLNFENIKSSQRYDNFIYRISLTKLPKKIEYLRGKWGYFYEYDEVNITKVANLINPKFQTLTYYGFEKSALKKFINKFKLAGLDRVVPIGQSLNIGLVWDGFDLQRSLSRIVEIK